MGEARLPMCEGGSVWEAEQRTEPTNRTGWTSAASLDASVKPGCDGVAGDWRAVQANPDLLIWAATRADDFAQSWSISSLSGRLHSLAGHLSPSGGPVRVSRPVREASETGREFIISR